MTDCSDYNISRNFFAHYHQIGDENGHPLTNVYWSKAPREMPVFGSVYFIHGYGGSPVEPCLKLPMQYALSHGFNVIAIEGADLSATATPQKNISTMTLERQKRALDTGLQFCEKLEPLNRDYKVAWIHSISCRAMSDLMIDSPKIRHYFNEMVLNNPYFLPPPKVCMLREKMYKRDPSGQTWDILVHKVTTQIREIENRRFTIPTCLYNLSIPLPHKWEQKPQFEDLARRVSFFVKNIRLHFILGTEDNMADYQQNLRIFRGLDIPNKQIISIKGANHSFDNSPNLYMEFSGMVLDAIKSRCVNVK